LKAVFRDGSLYRCTAVPLYRCKSGKSCIFQQVGKERKSTKELLDVIALVPVVNQEDLKMAAKPALD
jgi:hypothetical protein